MTIDRNRLLEAAARVYGELGFRGATTRRIADEAHVNEITLFRHFGSKETLIDEALRTSMGDWGLPPLPSEPHDPLVELTRWCNAVLDHLRHNSPLIRRLMSERDERPAVAPCVGTGPVRATQELRRYVARLSAHDGPLTPQGAECVTPRVVMADRSAAGVAETLSTSNTEAATAISMLMAALFADAMGRELMPAMYPQPADRAALAYVTLFLRAVGVDAVSPAARGNGGELR
jgi:AcrR family transcriptional regulator